MQSPTKKRKVNRTEKSLEYFTFSHEKNSKHFYICKICHHKFNGTKQSNLSIHLQNKHPEVLINDNSIEYKRKKLLLDCVELVSVNGRAFRCLNDSAILNMNESVLIELKSEGIELNLRDPHLYEVKSEMKSIYEKIQQKISNEVTGRMLSLMVDIVTKRDRSIFGTSLQYMIDDSVKIRSIGMIELEKSHTGLHLAGLVIGRLNLLGINLEQIHTVTTDNGANVLKMIRDMESHLQTATNQPPTPSKNRPSTVRNDLETNQEIEQILVADVDITEDEAYARIFGNVDDEISDQPSNETLLDSIKSSLANVYGLSVQWDVTGVNCAEHTFQLAINDSIKETPAENRNLIELCRRMAKFLRLKTTVYELNAAGISYTRPHNDVPTRWCFMYIMVNLILFYIYFHLKWNFHLIYNIFLNQFSHKKHYYQFFQTF